MNQYTKNHNDRILDQMRGIQANTGPANDPDGGGPVNVTPRSVMIQTLRAWMLGDYGHDLPAEHFEQEVDRLLAALDEFGLTITSGDRKGSADE